jgi:hypothetical protein
MEAGNWDRSHEWVLRQTHRSLQQLKVVFGANPSARQLLSVRQISEKYRRMELKLVKECITDGKLLLGIFSSIEARTLRQNAVVVGLLLEVRDVSTTTFLPFDRTTRMVWLIEDEKESTKIAKELMEAGVPIEYTEAD